MNSRQAGQVQFSSIGPLWIVNSAFFKFSVPSAVKAVPFRASRVGNTQSNMSIPRRDHLEHLRRSAETHRVTRFVLWQKRLRRFNREHHFLLRLADAHSADRVAVEINLDRGLRSCVPQISNVPPCTIPKTSWR